MMTAIKLLEAGFPVTLFDHKIPWDKPCGGMITERVLEEFPLINEFLSRTKQCFRMYYESPDGERKSKRVSSALYVLSRFEFSKFLLDKAQQLGVDLITEKVRSVEENDDFFTLRTKTKLHNSEIIIRADGVYSMVRRLFMQKIPKKELGLACGYLLKQKKEDHFLMKYLDIEGYIWVFPGKNNTCVGIGDRMGENTRNELFKKLDTFLEDQSDDVTIVKQWHGILPMINTPEFYQLLCSGPNWLLIGDAAGHVDPINGEGIYYALKSAELAANSIIMNDLPYFDILWRQNYGKRLKKHANHMNRNGKLRKLMGPKMVGTVMYNNSVYNIEE